MSKKLTIVNIAFIAAAILILVVLGFWLGSIISIGSGKTVASSYSAVYLSNGDMYFGALSWFPKPRLSNVWVVQKQTDQNNQQQLNIAQFTKAFWAPMDEIYLNPKEIVWWSRLRSDSQIARIMDNPSVVQQQQQLPPAATSTPKSSSD